MVEIIRKLETAVSWSVHQNEEKLSQLEREIYSGQDWDDLSAVLDAVEATYQEGKISYEEAVRHADSANEVRLAVKLSEGGDAESLSSRLRDVDLLDNQ